MRLIDTFFEEFSNWPAVFEAIGMRLRNEAFILQMFPLLDFVIMRIKNNFEPDAAEIILRLYAHTAIDYLKDIDPQYVTTYECIVLSVLRMDPWMKFLDTVRL